MDSHGSLAPTSSPVLGPTTGPAADDVTRHRQADLPCEVRRPTGVAWSCCRYCDNPIFFPISGKGWLLDTRNFEVDRVSCTGAGAENGRHAPWEAS